MPELPEVETVRLQLLDKLKHKTITEVEVYNPKTVGEDKRFSNKLKNLKIRDIDRIGKLLIFSFVNQPDLFMIGHLKMTGQFLWMGKKGVVLGGGHTMTQNDKKDLPNKHTRVAITLNDGSSLFFNDMRKFGYLKLVNAEELRVIKNSYGQEPISDSFSMEEFYRGLKKRQRVIKAVLLDQTFVAGLGNIYVDEALFKAGIRPTRQASKLSKNEAIRLAQVAREVLVQSIKVGGTTFRDFAHTDGESGNYTDYLEVFAKNGQTCRLCGGIIKKIRVAGRGTHYCQKCQR